MNPELFYPYLQQCTKVSIDSRTIAPGDIFFAFSGENFNAAELAGGATDKGALAVIVERKEFEDSTKNIFYVPSTLQFMQDLARLHRDNLKIPVIGLTGSNGKTTTKELIAAVLSKRFNVLYTHGNLNNHIGVPLTIMSVKPEHEIAVIEMGANHQKEIEFLCSIAQPDYGYITNFGKAHLEGFGGFEGVIAGKSELYTYLKENKRTIIVNAEDPLQVQKTTGYEPVVSFGTEDADYHFASINKGNFVGLSFGNTEVISQLTGAFNFSNLSAATTLGLHFGLQPQEIKEAIEGYQPTNMRSQVMVKNGITLVLDTYNANPSSMAGSLQNFNTFKGSKTVIIGDMRELGPESLAEHTAILRMALDMDFDQIITVGDQFEAAGRSSLSFTTTAELTDYLRENPVTSKNILLKASRGIGLEKVLEYL